VRLRERVNLSQKVVIAVALGVALAVIGHVIEWSGSAGGWFGYAPNTDHVFTPRSGLLGRNPTLDALWWLAGVAVWMAVCLWLFSQPGDVGDGSDDRS
jgi:hypothetical protein